MSINPDNPAEQFKCGVFGFCSPAGDLGCNRKCDGCENYETRGNKDVCAFRGPVIREDTNNICGTKGQAANIYQCSLYGECATHRYCKVQTVRNCMFCSDFCGLGKGFNGLRWPCEPTEPALKIDSSRFPKPTDEPKPKSANVSASTPQHLIYHIWPRKDSNWQWNVDQLLKRIELFTGVRTIGIATGGNSETAETVKAAFSDHRIDNWIEAQNRPSRGEGVTFQKMLCTLPADGITFYGHAKGARHQPESVAIPQRWAELMYRSSLDNLPIVVGCLKRYPMAGPFRRFTQFEGRNWHFSGTYFWFRNEDVFAKPESRNLSRNYWCVESWPGGMFEASEVDCYFGNDCGNLYSLDELEKWEAVARTMETKETKGPSISVIVPSLGRPSLPSMIESLQHQARPADEIIVIADGDESRKRIESMGLSGIRLEQISDPLSHFGNAQRNRGLELAQGNVLWFVDDDDTAICGALGAIRHAMQSGSPTMFGMLSHGELLDGRQMAHGRVSGQMMVVPNAPNVPRWPVPSDDPEHSDFQWLQKVHEWRPVQYSPAVIYEMKRRSLGQFQRT